MRVCKKCGYEGEFKFCPDCGEHYVVTVEERLDIIETKLIDISNKINLSQNVFIKKNIAENNKVKKSSVVDLEERHKLIIKYVRNHPNRLFSLKKIFEECFNIGIGGKNYIEFEEFLNKHPTLYGVKIIKKGKHIRLKAKKKNDKKTLPKYKLAPERREKLTGMLREIAKLRVEIKKEHQDWTMSQISTEAGRRYKEKYMIRKKPNLPLTEAQQHSYGYNIEPAAEKIFPDIAEVDTKYENVLIDMFKNIIREGGKLSLQDAECVNVNKGSSYNKFMSSIAFNITRISAYFGIENKFSFVGDYNNRVLYYGGK